MIVPMIDERCTALGMTVDPPTELDRLHWELTHLCLFINGSWDTVPQWALQFRSDHLGGDHHVYMLAFRRDGSRAMESELFYLGWPDGDHFFSPVKEHDWVGNAPINAGYNWRETAGPYFAQMKALSSSRVNGLGLPYPDYPWTQGLAQGGLPTLSKWDGVTMVGEVAEDSMVIMGGLHTSHLLVFQEVDAASPPPPLPGGCFTTPAMWVMNWLEERKS